MKQSEIRRQIADLEQKVKEFESLPEPRDGDVEKIAKRIRKSLGIKMDRLAEDPILQEEVVRELLRYLTWYKSRETASSEIKRDREKIKCLKESLPEIQEAKREEQERSRYFEEQYLLEHGHRYEHGIS